MPTFNNGDGETEDYTLRSLAEEIPILIQRHQSGEDVELRMSRIIEICFEYKSTLEEVSAMDKVVKTFASLLAYLHELVPSPTETRVAWFHDFMETIDEIDDLDNSEEELLPFGDAVYERFLNIIVGELDFLNDEEGDDSSSG